MLFEKLFNTLADLPVAKIADDVTLSVLSGNVTTLSSATGSGKTLYESAHLAAHADECVVVLVPRRFLAVSSAEIVADLAGCTVGTTVGYAVGTQSGDRPCFGKDTKLLFATYGYALASGLIWKANVIVLDEVHETPMDLSIIRALLRLRMSRGESIKLLEMSATMNTARQAAYWSDCASTEIFEIDGKTFDCEVRHRPASRVEDEVMHLIDEGRRGILVFRPGKGEVEETAEKIRKLAERSPLTIEVAEIYGEMGYVERRDAIAAPANGRIKVLVGTNVVESGTNIPWLDSGVSCGTGKENSVRPGTGATFLELIDLPRWRLAQQEGRVKRFCPGIFVLCSPKSFGEREQASRPEIERLALTELVMHCAGFGLRTHELTFDYAPETDKVTEAELKLQRLGLITEDCMLTDAGKAIAGMPVGPETGAMLWHAIQTDCLAAMLPLAAVIEVDGLRKNFRYPHSLDSSSDHLDAVLALREIKFAPREKRKQTMQDLNVSYKRYEAALDLLRELERRFDTRATFDFDDYGRELGQAILAGSLDKLFVASGMRGMVSLKNRYTTYNIGHGSVLSGRFPPKFVAGDLRVITPKDGYNPPFTVIEKVTSFELDDLKELAEMRPEILTEETQTSAFGGGGYSYTTYKLFGEYVIEQVAVRSDPPVVEPEPVYRPNVPTSASSIFASAFARARGR